MHGMPFETQSQAGMREEGLPQVNEEIERRRSATFVVKMFSGEAAHF